MKVQCIQAATVEREHRPHLAHAMCSWESDFCCGPVMVRCTIHFTGKACMCMSRCSMCTVHTMHSVWHTLHGLT